MNRNRQFSLNSQLGIGKVGMKPLKRRLKLATLNLLTGETGLDYY